MTEEKSIPGFALLVIILATLDQLFLPPDTYSLVGGVLDLFAEDEFLIGLVILLFSVLFPIDKIVVLLWIFIRRHRDNTPPVRLALLEFLCKPASGRWPLPLY